MLHPNVFASAIQRFLLITFNFIFQYSRMASNTIGHKKSKGWFSLHFTLDTFWPMCPVVCSPSDSAENMCSVWGYWFRRYCPRRYLWPLHTVVVIEIAQHLKVIKCILIIHISTRAGGVNALIAIRILMGIFQGPMLPSFAQLLSAWVPTVERAFLGTFAYSGMVVRTWWPPRKRFIL